VAQLRLTLRTLLAYLDDTLQPTEIKAIGQKVAESDAAQELVDRIKAVTRRRRLTIPPATGPNARFDANVVAEYLDNELPADEMVDVEKVCLESDGHLAEIAACHQILTLVLGEPALVPPTAKERMYKLVAGKEAAGGRKSSARSSAAAEELTEPASEDVVSGPWGQYLLPGAVLAALVVVGLLLWQLIPPRRTPHVVEGPNEIVPVKVEEKNDKGTVIPPVPVETADGGNDVIPPPREDVPPVEEPKDPIPVIRPVAAPPGPPSMERAVAGRYIGAEGNYPSILVHRAKADDREIWQRVGKERPVSSGDSLVCLPGFKAEIDTNGGVRLLMRGHVREFSVDPFQEFLMDSAVVLHQNPHLDLDLTLDRGRIYLTNVKEKGPAKIRLRFATEKGWDITLMNPGDQVGVDLFKHFTADIDYQKGEEPRADFFLACLKGEAEVRIDAYHPYPLEAPPGPSVMMWDSFTLATGPHKQGSTTIWNKNQPDNEFTRPMLAALRDLDLRLSDKRSLENVLTESFAKEAREPKLLAMYSLAAIDDVSQLIDYLADSDPSHFLERDTAIFALRRWISRSAAQGLKLYDEKTKTGELIRKGYRPNEAETVFSLLHNFKDEDRRNPDTFEALADQLRSKKVAIASLAYWHLVRMALPEKLKVPFNPADPQEERDKAATEVKDLVTKRKLPPPPPARPATPPAGS
jgi:hypothetical protein